jgi:8-amino-7-oxononanoate synthase
VTLPRIDASDEGFAASPFGAYAALRTTGPVTEVILANGRSAWFVTGHAAARSVLGDGRFSAEPPDPLSAALTSTPRKLLDRHMLNTDGPDHARLRRLARTAFTGPRIEALAPRVAEVSDGLLDAMPTSEVFDLVTAYAFPLPVTVICEVLGVPAADHEALRGWTYRVGSPRDDETDEAWAALLDYFAALIAAKRRRAGEDMFSTLVQARDDEGLLSEDELLAMAFLLLFAGYETTMNLSSALLTLLTQPTQRAAAIGSWDTAIEEFLRHGSPLEGATWRWALSDVEVAGIVVPAGSSVNVSLAAANRDPARFVDPDVVDLRRTPNSHLAFGYGSHVCLGARLARIEASYALPQFLARFPNARLAIEPDAVRWCPGLLVRGPQQLPVRIDDPVAQLRVRADERRAQGLRRTLMPRPPHSDVLDLASNDYLGLTHDPRVVAGAVKAATTWGGGATGSRLVTGSTQAHHTLENDLAAFVGAEAGVVLSSGYLANLAAVTSLSGRGDLVVSDAQNHASVVDACRLTRARVVVTPHRDVVAVDRALAERTEERALVVTDAVFSVDGDLAPLSSLAAVCRRNAALLLVDEAHAIGVLGSGGQGAVHAALLAGAPDVVITATLSKSLGSQGGAVLGPREVIEHLIDSARPFIFDTGLAPAAVGAAQAALGILRREPELAARVRAKAKELAQIARAAGWQASEPAASVTSLLVGAPDRAVAAAAACLARGVQIGCFRPPSVPDGVSRLRLTARADLTPGELRVVARVLTDVGAEYAS